MAAQAAQVVPEVAGVIIQVQVDQQLAVKVLQEAMEVQILPEAVGAQVQLVRQP
jgi:hypothetical protein